VDRDDRFLKDALSKIVRFLKGSVDLGKMSQTDADDTITRITSTTDIQSVAGKVDLVIEAIIEEKDSKTNLFRQLDGL
jgi:3-hydroxybutyryl-CoA dehydrogenase